MLETRPLLVLLNYYKAVRVEFPTKSPGSNRCPGTFTMTLATKVGCHDEQK